MIKLSDFLVDMQDSEDNKVLVTEAHLREFAQQHRMWEQIAQEQTAKLAEAQETIKRLKDEIIHFKLNQPITVDLFA